MQVQALQQIGIHLSQAAVIHRQWSINYILRCLRYIPINILKIQRISKSGTKINVGGKHFEKKKRKKTLILIFNYKIL